MPIRSTLGVSRLVTFGDEPARIESSVLDLLKQQAIQVQMMPEKIYASGERVRITQGAFAGIEAIFEMDDGESRAMVLIEMLTKPTRLKLPVADLAKV